MALNPPHDLSLHPVWNHAVSWISYSTGEERTDENVQPLFEKFLNKIPVPLNTPYNFTDVPGLVLRFATKEDIPTVADIIIKAGNAEAAWAHQMLAQVIDDPFSWALIWELNGERMQFEVIVLGPDTEAYLGYLVHFKRELPQWVWAVLEVPVVTWLNERGYKTVKSLMRKNRVYRLPRMQKVHNIQQVGEFKDFVRLEWKVEENLLHTMPARRTVGDSWTFTYGPMLFREMQQKDLKVVQKAIREEFALAGLNNGDAAASMLEDRWYLERAAVLLGYVNGKLKFVRTAREREGGQAAVANLHPMLVTKEARVASYVAISWLSKLGYTSAVSFVPEAQARSPKMKQYWDAIAPFVYKVAECPHFDGPVHEMCVDDFSPILGIPLDQWMQS